MIAQMMAGMQSGQYGGMQQPDSYQMPPPITRGKVAAQSGTGKAKTMKKSKKAQQTAEVATATNAAGKNSSDQQGFNEFCIRLILCWWKKKR
jgi:hypothetical protein